MRFRGVTMFKGLAVAAAVLASAMPARAAISTAEAARLEASSRVIQEIRDEIPDDYWSRAHCVVVIPDLKKAAFIFGGEYGRGIMSCRSQGAWSAPIFMQLAKGSWGFQAGVEQVDLVMLVMNERGIDKLLRNKTTLGADASVAAGPVGRRSAVATDAQLSAEILSYSRSQGLFAGINVSGGVLRPDEDSNIDGYGRGVEPADVLARGPSAAPPEARAFLTVVSTVPAPTATTPERTSTSAGGLTVAADSDPKARVIEMQQAIDRMLAGASGNAVGTAGATTSNDTTVTVDRARLLLLRQQLDALLADLNRR
jgi:lipid-binding SYLF domain-containing protein